MRRGAPPPPPYLEVRCNFSSAAATERRSCQLNLALQEIGWARKRR